MKLRLCFVANSSSSDYVYVRHCDICEKPLDFCECVEPTGTHMQGRRQRLAEQKTQQELQFIEQEVIDEIAPWIRFKQ